MADMLETEQAVIGSILIDSRSLPYAAAILTKDDFALSMHQDIFAAALGLDRDGHRVDPVTLLDCLRKQGVECSNKYMMELMEITPTAANIEEYAEKVRENSMRRSVANVAATMQQEASGYDAPADIISSSIRALEEISAKEVSTSLATTYDMETEFFAHRDLVESGDGKAVIKTGLPDLDKLLGGGMLLSGLYIIAARPGMGKTSLAINIADNVSSTGGGVLYISLEMDLSQIAAKRYACAIHKVSKTLQLHSDRLLMGQLEECEQEALYEASKTVRKKYPTNYNKKPTVTLGEIETMARKIPNLRLIVVDHLGLISAERGSRSKNRYEIVTEFSLGLKAMARKYKVPVLALSQLSRANEKDGRTPRKPRLSDLRETGAIEQDADGVILLHRDDYYSDDDDDDTQKDVEKPVITKVILAKNRHGATGPCRMGFYMPYNRFIPVDYRSEPRPAPKKPAEPEYKQCTLQELPKKTPVPFDEGGK